MVANVNTLVTLIFCYPQSCATTQETKKKSYNWCLLT